VCWPSPGERNPSRSCSRRYTHALRAIAPRSASPCAAVCVAGSTRHFWADGASLCVSVCPADVRNSGVKQERVRTERSMGLKMTIQIIRVHEPALRLSRKGPQTPTLGDLGCEVGPCQPA
jgi:hypothetical protein